MSKPHNPHEEAAGAPAGKEQNESSAKPARTADAAAAEPNSIEFRLHRPAQPASGDASLKAGEKSAGEAQSKPNEVTRGTLSLGGRHAEPVPDSVLERFIKVGNNFYFRDGTEAFIDRGNKITTHSENMVVIQSMVAIARERAKGEVTVKGTEFFRKEAWFAARLAGLEVRGYEPTQLEQERLVRAIARRQEIAREEPPLSPDVPRAESRHDRQTRLRTGSQDPAARSAPAESELLVGRLVDHGPAPFDRNDKNPMNYYVRVETEHGDVERWGVDLERAFRHSLSTPGIGDQVGLRVVGQDMVTVRSPKYDAQGRKIGEEKLDTQRNRWIVERKDFLDRRQKMAGVFRDAAIKAAQATQLYPELEGSYLQFQMGISLAEQQYTNKDRREQLVNHMREYLAKIIESGKPLEPVPLRDRGDRTPQPEQAKDRDLMPTR